MNEKQHTTEPSGAADGSARLGETPASDVEPPEPEYPSNQFFDSPTADNPVSSESAIPKLPNDQAQQPRHRELNHGNNL